jgi:hypothetical protein
VSRLQRTATQVQRYVEYVLPKYERSGATPETPVNRKERGTSRPVVGDHALDVMEANGIKSEDEREKHGQLLERRSAVLATLRSELYAIEAGRNGAKSSDGVPYTVILGAVRYDAGVIQTWRTEQTRRDKEASKALWEMCLFVAWIILYHHDTEDAPLNLYVSVDPEDLQQRQKTHEGRKRDTAHTDRVIVRRVESLETEGLGREEAKRALTEDPENTWSYWRIDRAIVDENRRMRSDEGAA